MRYENFLEKEYYHLWNSGIDNAITFNDDEDKNRFIFLLTHFQSPIRINNINWYINRFIKRNAIAPNDTYSKKILKRRNVELLAFSILPNKFEILAKNLTEKILSVYMQRILTGYSKYYNSKYKKSGHVFAGTFKACKIKPSELAQTSALIHLSSTEIPNSSNDYVNYPFSSYQDYLGENRWGIFLERNTILKHFENQSKYREFVDSLKPLNNL